MAQASLVLLQGSKPKTIKLLRGSQWNKSVEGVYVFLVVHSQ